MQKLNQGNHVTVNVTDLASLVRVDVIRVLHVDDDPCILRVSKAILLMKGNFEVDCACCVDEAFKKLETGNYDVVVSDFEMPKKDGLEFLRELRDAKNDVPFILFTGKGREEVAVKALNLGADAYLNKQGNPETVYGELAHYIRLSVSHRKAKEALKANEEKFRAISDCAMDAIVMIDDKLKVAYWNLAAERIFGYTQEEALGKDTSFLAPQQFHEHTKKSLKKLNKISLTSIAGEPFEMIGHRKNGKEFPMEISCSRLQIRGNSYLVTTIRDVTERKRMHKKLEDYSSNLKYMVELRTVQLKDTNERLVKSERLAAIGELAGMVGHDLRNPLAGIKNAAYFLKKKSATISETETKTMLEIIENEIDHSDKIVNDLLDYAMETRLELRVCSARKVLQNILSTIIVPETVKVTNNIPDKITIRIDQSKIERVFINLVENAIDAMPNGGTLTIDCTLTNGNVEISFADTGTGISEEILPNLFSPLFTTKAQGMGFGLAICKRIIEAHGGKITVETSKGKGTTFRATLPIEQKRE